MYKRLSRQQYQSSQRAKLWVKRSHVATEFLRKLKSTGAIVDFTQDDVKKQVIEWRGLYFLICAQTLVAYHHEGKMPPLMCHWCLFGQMDEVRFNDGSLWWVCMRGHAIRIE